MATFGSFETEREIYATPTYTVYSARKAGDAGSKFVVKVFSTQSVGFDTDVAGEIRPVTGDIEASRVQALAVQEKGAAASRYIEPVLETGRDERGVWYATRYYDFSVSKLLIGRVALPRDAFQHIIRSIAQGALDFKRACGRSHGGIQPSNVHISKGELSEAEVVLSDPLPVGAVETADLRAIGSILLQLVRQRAIESEEIAFQLPIVASAEWTRVFGRHTERWVSLCNRLLDPNLSLEQLTLDQLVQELAQLSFKRRISRKAILAGAVGGVALGIAAIVGLMYFKHGNLLITTDPPGAEIKLEVRGKYKTFGRTPLDRTPLSIKWLPANSYKLQAQYPGLTEQTSAVTVEGGKSRVYSFTFPYGLVTITSTPANVEVELDKKPVGFTPYTSGALAPGPKSFVLRLADYQEANIGVIVSSNGQAFPVEAKLTRRKAGEWPVEFLSMPDGALISEGTNNFGVAPIKAYYLVAGPHKITAHYLNWPPVSTQMMVVPGEDKNPAVNFVFPYGTARFTVDPPDAEIFLDDVSIGREVHQKLLQPRDYKLRVTHSGYKPSETKVVTISEGKTMPISVSLEPMTGTVEFTTDPPGAAIFEAKAPSQELGRTQQGQPFTQSFKPEKYTFIARYDGLDDVTSKPMEVAMGARIPLALSFSHATVRFDTDPRGADVLIAGKRMTTPCNYYQKPGPISYRVEMADYSPEEGATQLVASANIPYFFRLRPKSVGIRLVSDPPGAQFSTADGPLSGADDRFSLPWGSYFVTARHLRYPALGEVTNAITVKKGAQTVEEFRFNFTYATLILTNLPEDATIKEGNQDLAVTPGPIRLAYDRPGPHPYDIYQGGQKTTNFLMDLKVGFANSLPPVLLGVFANGIDMKLVKVRNLFGPGRDGWVGKYEVTQREYERVMGPGTDPSNYKDKGPDLPVQNLSWQQAKMFCDKLTAMDRNPPPGYAGHYALPTVDLWRRFATNATVINAVIEVPHPAPVGSKGADSIGLNDVLGNVREWLDSPDPKNKPYIGGAYTSRLGFRGAKMFMEGAQTPEERDSNASFPDVGMRVLWLPIR